MTNLKKTMILYFIGYFILGNIIVNILPDSWYMYGQLILVVMTFFLTIYYAKDYFNINFIKDMEYCLNKSIKLGIYTFIIVMISITLNSISRSLNLASSTSNNNHITVLINNYPIITGFIIILFLPFIEEIVFKWQLFKNTKFLVGHSFTKTIIIGLLFASLHCLIEIINLDWSVVINFINYLLFYCCTMYAYSKSKNLMVPILIHCLYNAISFILVTF